MEQEGAHIVITKYSTFTNAVCEICRWTTVDQQRLEHNVSQHQSRHKPQPSVIRRIFQPKK